MHSTYHFLCNVAPPLQFILVRDGANPSLLTKKGKLNMDSFCKCPRCGERAFEKMSSYSHCVSCLYFEDRYVGSETLLYKAVQAERELLKQYDEESDQKTSEDFARTA